MSQSEDQVIEKLIEMGKEKVEFTIETILEGELGFDLFKVWRSELLSKNVKDIEKLDAEDFAKTLMKFSLYSYKDLIINHNAYNNDESIFDNIDLKVNKEEITKFAEKFLDDNDYLLYKSWSEDISKYNQNSKKNREPYFDFPEDPLEKLKKAFILEDKRQREFTEKILGLSVPKNFSSTVNLIKQQQQVEKIFNSSKSFSPIIDIVNQHKDILSPNIDVDKEILDTPLKNNSNFDNILNEDSKYKSKINSSIIRTPELIENSIEHQKSIGEKIDFQLEKLIQLQKVISDNNTMQRKVSNEILQKQFDITKEDIDSSNSKSNNALFISIFALIASTLIGCYQIYDSSKTSERNFEKYDSIKNAIIDGNNIHKEQIDIINKLIKENENLKDKVDVLENKLK